VSLSPSSSSLQKANWVFFRDSAALQSSVWAECCFRGVVSMFVAVGEIKKQRCTGNNKACRSRRKFEGSDDDVVLAEYYSQVWIGVLTKGDLE